MGACGARTFAATLHFNNNRQSSDAVSTAVPFRITKRAAVFVCRAKDGIESTEYTVKDQQGEFPAPSPARPPPNPFASGKISSRVKVRPLVEQQTESTSSETPSQPPVSSPSASKKSVTSSPGPSSSSPKPSRLAKAFQAPEISSPFDTPADKKKPMSNNRLRSFADVDERILASRKEILNALYKEEKTERKLNSVPANVVDDPKPLPGDGEYKFELIKGTSPFILIISFSLIAGVMFGTAFIAWKLGAFHYNEL